MGRRSDNYNEKPHAMMIPIPLPGHINPFVHLAIKLASNGFTITFVHTQSVHHQLITTDGNDDVFVEARKSGVDIRYKTISDGLALEFDRSANEKEFWNSILHVFPSNVDELVGKLVDDDDDDDDYSPPTCLISDTFYAWPATIANKYKLVNVSLWTESALVFAIYSNLDLFIQNAHLPNPNPNPNGTYVSTRSISTYVRNFLIC